MRTVGTNRHWLVAGALGAVALLAVGWFFFVSPQYKQAGDLRDQTSAQQSQIITLQHQLVQLRQQSEQLAQYQAKLAKDRHALPTAAGLTDFLRELHAVGDVKGIAVTGLIVGSPTAVAGTGAEMFALPITVTAKGSAAALSEFLVQLQQLQPRAVLISDATGAAAGEGGSFAGPVVLTLRLQAYVAPAGIAATGTAAATKTN